MKTVRVRFSAYGPPEPPEYQTAESKQFYLARAEDKRLRKANLNLDWVASGGARLHEARV